MFAFFDLKALNPERNIDRFYTLRIDRTLFDEYALIIHHGRNGFKGRRRAFYYEDIPALLKKVKQILKKRLNAKSRLGTDYQILQKDIDESFEKQVSLE